ncbi:hypothetical protein JHW43_000933 [Diplocarpon mali]|nr:hypothetical protein JHW43_000933 [Diplocarpon mali]
MKLTSHLCKVPESPAEGMLQTQFCSEAPVPHQTRHVQEEPQELIPSAEIILETVAAMRSSLTSRKPGGEGEIRRECRRDDVLCVGLLSSPCLEPGGTCNRQPIDPLPSTRPQSAHSMAQVVHPAHDRLSDVRRIGPLSPLDGQGRERRFEILPEPFYSHTPARETVLCGILVDETLVGPDRVGKEATFPSLQDAERLARAYSGNSTTSAGSSNAAKKGLAITAIPAGRDSNDANAAPAPTDAERVSARSGHVHDSCSSPAGRCTNSLCAADATAQLRLPGPLAAPPSRQR